MSSCCSDCFEWFVEFIIRTEREDPFLNDQAYGDGDEDGAGSDPKPVKPPRPPTKPVKPPTPAKPRDPPACPSTESLSSHSSFRRERMKQLFNKHGFNLAMFPGGHVKGVREAFNPHSVLEILPTEQNPGEVRIRGVETGAYLAMNASGRLSGENNTGECTVFIEKLVGPYLVYLSKVHSDLGWHIGLKKSGDPKNGRRTVAPWGQKAILFVHRKPFATHHPLKQIQNRHGMTLAIYKDGKVKGLSASHTPRFDMHSVLEFSPSHPAGAFRIRGVESDLYLAMDDKGRLYGERDRLEQGTLFTEHSQGRYFIYLSVRFAHLGWHVGLTKSGKAKRAQKTVFPAGQKAIQFSHKVPYPQQQFNVATLNNGDGGARVALGDDNFPPLAFIDEEEEGSGGK